ncbi:MAG: outer membrane beta-barrel protein [Candidatus Zixiibacteriota bacterium]
MTKKLIFAVVLFLVLVVPVMAQTAYNVNDKVLQAGLGLGMAGLYGDSGVPPVSVGLSMGYNDNISFGGLVGYASSKYTYSYHDGSDYGWKYTYIAIMARGSYHFDILNSSDIDTYVGLSLGYNVVTSSEFGDWYGEPTSASSSYLLYGAHFGIRYYFNPNMGVFGELGYGLSYATVGLSFKL